jgi:hypothetical protein
MKVIENFERALGYTLRWRGTSKLTVLPHAFEGENAFFDPATNSLQFGYFAADSVNPGPNLPGQMIFTCLSHDIIAHETSHAIVHRLRQYFNEPTNRDVLGFHEAVADIVAIFQHFTFPDVLRHEIRATRADLTQPGRMLQLAAQFGYSTGSGAALRNARGDGGKPDPKLYTTLLEPHDRGSILVSAVFDAFFRIYSTRLQRHVRIATGGTGVLPEGELQADLADAAAGEASSAAQEVLTMCLRAFEYLPPVDVTFGDYLRAIVTADFELNPKDEFERRAAFIDSFRMRGIYAPNVSSLAEEALRLDRPPELENVALAEGIVGQALARQFEYMDVAAGERRSRSVVDPTLLVDFAKTNAEALQLDRNRKIALAGFHPSFHVDENGQLRAELVAQWVQTPRDESRIEVGGVPLRGGVTVVFSSDGAVRYVAAKPLPGAHLMTDTQREAAEARVAEFYAYADALDSQDAMLVWADQKYVDRRMSRRANLGAAHRQSRRAEVPKHA